MTKQKILIFNISTDSNNTSLGFAINWINKFSEYYDEIDVVTLNKGDTRLLNENVNIFSCESENSNKFTKILSLRKIIKNLIQHNNYKYCLSHMSSALLLISFTILRFKNIKSILWYTHIGPSDRTKKIVLYSAAVIADQIVTASHHSFPLDFKKVTTIGHAINFQDLYKEQTEPRSNDFLIISRISRSKNIDESIQGFLYSIYGKSQNITIVGGPLTQQDEVYENYLKKKYSEYRNVRFVGSVPHINLSEFINQSGFHINNTPMGFYDKSVLETLASGLINFYNNPDYDRNIPPEYIDFLKFDGTDSDLTKKIQVISEFQNETFTKIIKFSQNRVKDESIETLHKRIVKVI